MRYRSTSSPTSTAVPTDDDEAALDPGRRSRTESSTGGRGRVGGGVAWRAVVRVDCARFSAPSISRRLSGAPDDVASSLSLPKPEPNWLCCDEPPAPPLPRRSPELPAPPPGLAAAADAAAASSLALALRSASLRRRRAASAAGSDVAAHAYLVATSMRRTSPLTDKAALSISAVAEAQEKASWVDRPREGGKVAVTVGEGPPDSDHRSVPRGATAAQAESDRRHRMTDEWAEGDSGVASEDRRRSPSRVSTLAQGEGRASGETDPHGLTNTRKSPLPLDSINSLRNCWSLPRCRPNTSFNFCTCASSTTCTTVE
mmetsp:Transcript_9706/g.30787  ORF Transcript_9706/g.30787 Transcript_9706/m.30787 type:complete len:315 (+) Transcript_9706:1852-2796(+)